MRPQLFLHQSSLHHKLIYICTEPKHHPHENRTNPFSAGQSSHHQLNDRSGPIQFQQELRVLHSLGNPAYCGKPL